MIFAISTHWNALRHRAGESMVEEILGLGITHLELGYDLRMDLVPGVVRMVEQKAAVVDSVHNYCPVPVGVSQGHPELFTLASSDRRIRAAAVMHTRRTVDLAAELGAKAVVVHAGNVEMRNRTRKLMDLAGRDEQYSDRYGRVKLKLQLVREKKVGRQLEYLYEGVDQLLPLLESTGVKLAFENLPSWESIPTESEMEKLLMHFGSRSLGYWHDIGHGQVRENLGFIGHVRWLEKLAPHLLGLHIHDVAAPGYDHLMPPKGHINFARFKEIARRDILRVFEPLPGLPREELAAGMAIVREAWGTEEESR